MTPGEAASGLLLNPSADLKFIFLAMKLLEPNEACELPLQDFAHGVVSNVRKPRRQRLPAIFTTQGGSERLST